MNKHASFVSKNLEEAYDKFIKKGFDEFEKLAKEALKKITLYELNQEIKKLMALINKLQDNLNTILVEIIPERNDAKRIASRFRNFICNLNELGAPGVSFVTKKEMLASFLDHSFVNLQILSNNIMATIVDDIEIKYANSLNKTSKNQAHQPNVTSLKEGSPRFYKG